MNSFTSTSRHKTFYGSTTLNEPDDAPRYMAPPKYVATITIMESAKRASLLKSANAAYNFSSSRCLTIKYAIAAASAERKQKD